MTTMTDYYPSRSNHKAAILKRQDPVVYQAEINGTSAPISEALIQHYADQGFMVLEEVFSQQEVAQFQKELDRLREDQTIQKANNTITEPGSGEVRSVFQIHQKTISPLFSQLATDPRLAKLAAYILNDAVYIHQSRLNYKPGFRGKEFYWHSDFETWHVEDGMPRMRALSMSILLTENLAYNGALLLIPGSHNAYVVCEGNTPDHHFKSSLKKQEYGVPSDISLERLVQEGGISVATGKPGSVLVFDCNTMHGSNGNITPMPRSNVFFVYNAISNKVLDPFCDQPPRPEYICSRQEITVI